ncbi:MAG: YegP family protein [Deltaproteobacteria bacterium]|nr:YegP family protein [Deltaproteobacteria bacterium]
MMTGKFELTKAKHGQFMFNLKASNGQVILTSELFKTKASAENGIESVRKNSNREEAFEERTNSRGEPYFILKATNGQEIGPSEYYSSKAAIENGIASVWKNAPDVKIDDVTV